MGRLTDVTLLIHNGYKPDAYLKAITGLINGKVQLNSVLDNHQELEKLTPMIEGDFNIGIKYMEGTPVIIITQDSIDIERLSIITRMSYQ